MCVRLVRIITSREFCFSRISICNNNMLLFIRIYIFYIIKAVVCVLYTDYRTISYCNIVLTSTIKARRRFSKTFESAADRGLMRRRTTIILPRVKSSKCVHQLHHKLRVGNFTALFCLPRIIV